MSSYSRYSPRRASYLALSLGLGLSASSLAQAETTLAPVKVEATVEESGKDSLRVTKTHIGKGNQELRDIPQSVTVVTEKLIEDRNLDTFKEVLHNTAGVSFLAAEGGEEDIRLRGFSLQASGDIFIDGLRDPAFYERDTFNYDRLEVLRGSASMLFGRGSTGGVANQVSKQPRLTNSNEISGTIGSGNYARVEGDFNLKTGDKSAFRVATMWTGSGAFGQYGAGLDKKGIAPSFRWGIGSNDEFLASLYYLDNHNGINYGMPWLTPGVGATNRVLVPVSAENYYGATSDVNAGTAFFGTLGHKHRFEDGSELKTIYRAGRFQRDQRASAIRFCQFNANNPLTAACPKTPVTAANLNDATLLTRGSQNKAMALDTQMLQSDYSGQFKAWGKVNRVLAGVDVANDSFSGDTPTLLPGVTLTKPLTAMGRPDDGAGVDESRRVRLRNREFDARALGVYAQNMLELNDAWKVIAGLRWDRFDGSYTTYSTTPATLGQNTGTRSRSDSLWSKRFGVLYQPTPMASFHFSYGTSFNTSGDTYQFDAMGSNTPPEASRNIELGAKLDTESGDTTFGVALFHATKYNERNRDEDSVTPTTYLLSGARHAAGIEFDVAGRITSNWEVFASYAWIPSARIDKGPKSGNSILVGEMVGARPGLTPKHTGTLWTTWQFSPRWRVGGGLNLRSDMAPQQAATIRAPGYVTADLMLEYGVTRDLRLKFNVNNIGDKLYADYLYRGHYVAGTPRNVQLSAIYKF